MDDLFDSSGSESEAEGLGGPFDHLTDRTIRIRGFLMDDLFTVSIIGSNEQQTDGPTIELIENQKKLKSRVYGRKLGNIINVDFERERENV